MYERKSLSILGQWEQSAEAVITPELKSTINTHAILGAVVCFLPLFGFESILYAIILWHMYSSISKKVGVPFTFSTIVSGFVINTLICIVSGMFDWLIGIAWIFSAIIMYVLTYSSGKSFLGLLYKIHSKNKNLRS